MADVPADLAAAPAVRPMRRRRSWAGPAGAALRYGLLLLGAAVMVLPFLDMIEPAGDTMLSRAIDDRLLRARLGE